MIIIPMAGLSRRFFDAGYQEPKYMLNLGGRSVFSHAVGGFSAYFELKPFLFIVRDTEGVTEFVHRECESLGIKDPRIAVLPNMTRGQAETVIEGLSRDGSANGSPITIFNIDTFRPSFRFPNVFDVEDVDGFLEVFEGSGANWSYVRPGGDKPYGVMETAEKVEISSFCSTGLYHFARADLFSAAYSEYSKLSVAEFQGGELYVAPLYNVLIRAGCDIRYSLIEKDDVVFCGTPTEYELLLAKMGS